MVNDNCRDIDSDSDNNSFDGSEDERTFEDENIKYCPITCPATSYDSLAGALDHDANHNDFNLLEYLIEPSHDDFFEHTIITINKCRSFLQGTTDENMIVKVIELKKYLKDTTVGTNGETNDEDFFRPVLNDDAFLMFIDDLEDLMEKRTQTSCESDATQEMKQSAEHEEETETVQQLQMKIKALEAQVAKASSYIHTMVGSPSSGLESSSSSKPVGPDNDTYYFSSYSHSSIHEIMLRDTVRTEAYQNAILNNPKMFENKVVMDIGCGTGILSLFAAKAGAKKVIAIDASDMYKEATEIAMLNGFDNVIKICHGKVEDLIEKKLLPLDLEKGEKVDVVISEWMGYALFFETMLPSVMVARDALMNSPTSGGTMWPNRSSVYLEGASDNCLDYWSNVYGMRMDPMKRRVVNELRKEASVEVVPADAIVTNRVELIVHDLNVCRDEDLDFEVPFELKSSTTSSSCADDKNEQRQTTKIDKLVISFDIDFDIPGSDPTSFSTGCQSTPTHWKQTSIWFDPEDVPLLNDGEILKGTFNMGRNHENHRDMDLIVRWEVGSYKNKDGISFEKRDEGTIKSKVGA